jgi:hypothetical protein
MRSPGTKKPRPREVPRGEATLADPATPTLGERIHRIFSSISPDASDIRTLTEKYFSQA